MGMTDFLLNRMRPSTRSFWRAARQRPDGSFLEALHGLIRGLDIVENVKRVSEPYKNANRKFHPQDSVIQVGADKRLVGGGHFAMIAGPCSVESEEQIVETAMAVKAAGTKNATQVFL